MLRSCVFVLFLLSLLWGLSCSFCGCFCYSLYGCFGSPLWGFWFSLVSISILILLYTFRYILKGNVIHSSSYNIVRVGLHCERCLDIDSLRTRSRATDCRLIQNIEYIYFLSNLDLIYLFHFVSAVRLDYKWNFLSHQKTEKRKLRRKYKHMLINQSRLRFTFPRIFFLTL